INRNAGRIVSTARQQCGECQFIESPRTGETIRVSRLAEPFWQDHFLGARRILTEETIL
ncbi:hypothetical protein O5853_31450, partial [Escherichia coli]|nr:hypothetical protein [Escherichia coli]